MIVPNCKKWWNMIMNRWVDKMKFWWFWRLRRWIRSDGYYTAGDERGVKNMKKKVEEKEYEEYLRLKKKFETE